MLWNDAKNSVIFVFQAIISRACKDTTVYVTFLTVTCLEYLKNSKTLRCIGVTGAQWLTGHSESVTI